MADEYVVKGIHNNKDAFFGIDHMSGYPCPAYSSGTARRTYDLHTALIWLEDCQNTSNVLHLQDAKVCKIVYEEVDISSIEEDNRIVDEMIEGMTEDQIRLMKSKLT